MITTAQPALLEILNAQQFGYGKQATSHIKEDREGQRHGGE